jgi:hypothetical protein
MPRKSLLPVALASASALFVVGARCVEARSALFGGGPFYTGGPPAMNTLRASGFSTIILWSIHVRANGDLVYNDDLIIANGAYVGRAAWPGELATLKQAPTSVTRVEVSVGAWSVRDFEAIRDLIRTQGTGPGSILYRNFQRLKTVTGADAVDFDDETLYDAPSATTFGVMLADLGYRVTLCPYTNSSFWTAVHTQINAARPGTVDRIYLQVYAGGAGNDPGTWSRAFGTAVDPGVWVKHGSGCAEGDSPATIQSKMASWKTSAGITGGFLWYYDDILRCPGGGTAQQYATAVNNGVGGSPPPMPTRTPTPRPTPTRPPSTNLALNRPATGTTACVASEGPAKAVNGSVSGGNSDKWCSLASTRWLQVDLGAARNITNFIVRHAGAGGEPASYNTRAFNLQVSSNASSWTTVATVANNTQSVTAHAIAARSARYVRLNVTQPTQTTDSAARIYELEVYGAP